MHKVSLVFSVICFLAQSTWGQNLHFTTKQFLDDKGQSYLELQYNFPSESLRFGLNKRDKEQAVLMINIELTQHKDTLYSTEYRLYSQERRANERFDLTDLKKVKVKRGPVEIKFIATDLLSKDSVKLDTQLFVKSMTRVSELSLTDSYFFLKSANGFSHNNLLLIPKVKRSYSSYEDTANIYFETYGKHPDYVIQSVDEQGNVTYSQTVKSQGYPINQHLSRFPLIEMGQGKVSIQLIAKETQQQLREIQVWVAQQSDAAYFSAIPVKRLKLYLDWVKPISSIRDSLPLNDSSLIAADSAAAKLAFMKFWTDRNPKTPWRAWRHYSRKVEYLNKTFGHSGTSGYKTDRGRIYLTYGPPADIIEMHNVPNTYPYEMWQYFNDGKTGDSRFYFVNFSFTQNNFILVHSTAQGEPKNPDWKKNIERTHTRNGNSNRRNWGSDWQKEFINE